MKTSKPFRWIIILTIVYIVLLIALQLTNIPINTIFFSVATGLVVWIVTQTLVKWLEKEEKEKFDVVYKHITDNVPCIKEGTSNILGETSHIKVETNQIRDNTNQILNIVKEKELILVEKKRDDLPKDFYEKLYRDVNEAGISGIALKKQLGSMTKPGGDALINSLKKNKGTNVKILISDPRSEFVHQRDVVERNNNKTRPCTEDILNSIRLIKALAENNRETLAEDSKLDIRMTKVPLPQAITFVMDIHKSRTLYMGLILHHVHGNQLPLYQIPNDTSLYHACMDSFKAIFEDNENTSRLFTWKEKVASFDPFDELKNSGFYTAFDIDSTESNQPLTPSNQPVPGI